MVVFFQPVMSVHLGVPGGACKEGVQLGGVFLEFPFQHVQVTATWRLNTGTLDIHSYLLRFGVLDMFWGVQIPNLSR